jgi:CRISPR-associated exonuclease Cas4
MAGGTAEHDKDKKRSSERKDIYGLPRESVKEILRKRSLADLELGLTGLIDVVLIMMNDELIPVEAKFTNLPYVQRQWRKQLTAYAILLEAEYKIPVTKGLLYFILQKKYEMIDIEIDDKEALKRDIVTIRELISSEKLPHKVDESKCGYCEMKKYCG